MSDLLAAAVDRLLAGGLVAMPTETVYGLAAIARDAGAVARVFALKGRPAANPLIVHASTPEMARDCCQAWPGAADRLARAFWPGPLTMVLPKAAWVPDIVTAGGPTVAVRVPGHPLALALIEAVGEPLVAPSANRSGYVSPTTADHVRGVWSEDDVLVLDGGPCEVGLESTVVAVGDDGLRVLRLGVIGSAELSRVAGLPVLMEHQSEGPVASPGRIGAHYQPRARVVLVRTEAELEAALSVGSSARPSVVLAPPGVQAVVDPPNRSLAMPGDADAYARALYAALRVADEAGPARIVVCVPAGRGVVWDAVRERLSRAAAGR